MENEMTNHKIRAKWQWTKQAAEVVF